MTATANTVNSDAPHTNLLAKWHQWTPRGNSESGVDSGTARPRMQSFAMSMLPAKTEELTAMTSPVRGHCAVSASTGATKNMHDAKATSAMSRTLTRVGTGLIECVTICLFGRGFSALLTRDAPNAAVQARRDGGIRLGTKAKSRRCLKQPGWACNSQFVAGSETKSLLRRPQFRVWLVIVVPHDGGVGGIKQNPGIHSADVAIAKSLVIILAVSRRVESLSLSV